MLFSGQFNYTKNRVFHAILLPVFIGFSRCIGAYSSAKFEINIQNSFQVQPLYKKGELLTSKSDKHLHGIGMRSVKKIVLKYKGRIEYKAQQNVFDISITFF